MFCQTLINGIGISGRACHFMDVMRVPVVFDVVTNQLHGALQKGVVGRIDQSPLYIKAWVSFFGNDGGIVWPYKIIKTSFYTAVNIQVDSAFFQQNSISEEIGFGRADVYSLVEFKGLHIIFLFKKFLYPCIIVELITVVRVLFSKS